ncbi:ADP-ribosyltransferase [Nonomuraea sp. LPB2021202275-12-8]|uniref:ADP-ribosyltransferase n=1 Tax=Nonomuraea sp. LPB2021202275-12-8 TaxID=3120159 RepID=UPI00300C4109
MGFDGLLVPDWAKPYVGWAVGTRWPEGDESGCFRLADACAASARNVMSQDGPEPIAARGDDWDGAALEEFLTFARGVWGGTRLELVERLVAAALEFNRVGVQVEYTKRMIEVSVWFLIFQIAWLLAAAMGPWGGVSLAMIGPRLQLTRMAIAQLGERLLINVGLFGALLGGMDLAVQASQSRRDDIDWEQVLASAGTGALTGAFLTGFTGFFPTRSMWGLMTRSGLAGGATAGTAELLSGRPLDENMLRTVLMNVTAGFVGGADAHWASWNPSTGTVGGGTPSGAGNGGDATPHAMGGPSGSGPATPWLHPAPVTGDAPQRAGGIHDLAAAHPPTAAAAAHNTASAFGRGLSELAQTAHPAARPADAPAGPSPVTGADGHGPAAVRPEPISGTTAPGARPSIDSLINGPVTPHAPAPQPFPYSGLTAEGTRTFAGSLQNFLASSHLPFGPGRHVHLDEPFGARMVAATFGTTVWGRVVMSLTDDQLNALREYISTSYEINAVLRDDALWPDHRQSILRQAEHIDAATRVRPLPQTIDVHRGVDRFSFAGPLDELPGTVQRDPGFMSTNLGTRPSVDRSEVYLHLRVPEGTPAIYLGPISTFKRERELLLGRDRSWFVEDVRHRDGVWHVYGWVLPQE